LNPCSRELDEIGMYPLPKERSKKKREKDWKKRGWKMLI
jgi:hypothetical protein